MKLLGNLVAFIQQEEVQKQGSLILKDPKYKKIVTHISDSVDTVSVGDEIVIDKGYPKTVEYNEISYFIIPLDSIAAIISKD